MDYVGLSISRAASPAALQVDYHPVALLEAATQQCVSTAASFDAASAARLVHGYALLQYRPPGLVAPLAARCVCIMHTFSPQDLSLLNSSLGMLLLDPGRPLSLSALQQLHPACCASCS